MCRGSVSHNDPASKPCTAAGRGVRAPLLRRSPKRLALPDFRWRRFRAHEQLLLRPPRVRTLNRYRVVRGVLCIIIMRHNTIILYGTTLLHGYI